MRTLITNDDGVDSAGIHALARAALDLGLDVVVAAPSWDSSGASASLTAVQEEGRFLVERRRVTALGDTPVFAVEAAPAFITLVAVRGAFGDPPELVLSGINRGPNTGHAVLHSGTVGAVLTGSTHGCRGVAFSMAVGYEYEWDTAVAVARRIVPWVTELAPCTVLNVNIPNVALTELRGIREARLATFGAVQANVTEAGHDGYVQLRYSEVERDLEPGTDAWMLEHGFASVTPLRAVCEDTSITLDGLIEESSLAMAGVNLTE